MPTRRPCPPGLSAPRKESRHSRTACRPRKLRWHSDLHCLLAVARPQVAIVGRACGIAALSPFRGPGCPSAAVAMPPVLRAALAPPPPPRGILRSCSAAAKTCRSPRPQNAVPYSQSIKPYPNQSKTPHPTPQHIADLCCPNAEPLRHLPGAAPSLSRLRPLQSGAAPGGMAPPFLFPLLP